ncbi:MAG TPA: GNAT family N-acetyltransferase [Gemmatimonadales bacterium]|nr:GNAT family N-acetyltransferase [Gemmatimonadales bacterium]
MSTIEHDVGEGRFYTRLPAGEALLAYRPVEAGVLDYYLTFVPAEARGRGIADALVREAVSYARTNGFRIVPSCWYVRVWFDRHPKERDLLAA